MKRRAGSLGLIFLSVGGGKASPISDAAAIRQKIGGLRDLNAAAALAIMRSMSTAPADCPVAPILRRTVYTHTLHRACELLGGVPELAVYLRVAIRELQRWLQCLEAPPQGVFLAAVDVVSRPKRV